MDQMRRGPFIAQRVLAGVFGLVFGGIGLTTLIAMWSWGSDGFDGPPLFFKIFASFLAIAFVAFGATMAFTAWQSGGVLESVDKMMQAAQQRQTQSPENLVHAAGGYTCPSCGAALAQNADVSPLGDVKCPFCGRWFNVHKNA